MFKIPYNKYHNKKITIDGITFDSTKESKRYLELKLLEKQGIIRALVLQPEFLLQEKFKVDGKAIREIKYIADFMYFDKEKNKSIVEDCKGFRTDVYDIKKKLFLYKYPQYKFMEI